MAERPIKHLTDLTVDVANETGMSKEQAKEFIYATFNHIEQYLKDGDDVSIYQFGRFKRIMMNDTTRIKPNTKELIKIPAHPVIHFSKSKKFEL